MEKGRDLLKLSSAPLHCVERGIKGVRMERGQG